VKARRNFYFPFVLLFAAVIVVSTVFLPSILTVALSEKIEDNVERVERLIEHLDSEDAEIRVQAAEALSFLEIQIGPLSDNLIDVIKEQEFGDTKLVVPLLKALSNAELHPSALLSQAIKSADEVLATHLSLALRVTANKQGRKQATAVLEKLLRNSSNDIRLRTIEAIGLSGFGSDDIFSVLEDFLSDSNRQIRYRSVVALSRLKPQSKQSRSLLRNAMSDNEESIANRAAVSLGLAPRKF